jgi:predicted ATPase
MRTVLTVILRLFVDTDQPDAVRGALQELGSPELALTFDNPEHLLQQINHLTTEQLKALSRENDST